MKSNLSVIAHDLFQEKYGTNMLLLEKLNYEINLARGRGFTNNILIAYDLAEFLKRKNIAYFAAGATASSFLMYVLGITKTNPLEPHYYCMNCGHMEYVKDVQDGFDLPEKRCLCGSMMFGDGHNIDPMNFWGQKLGSEWHHIWIAVSNKGFIECYSFLLNHPLIKGKSTYKWFNENEVSVDNILLLKSDALDNCEPTQKLPSNEGIRQFAFNKFINDYTWNIDQDIKDSWNRYNYIPSSFAEVMTWYGMSHGVWNFESKNKPVKKITGYMDVVNNGEALRIGDIALEMKTPIHDIPVFYEDVYGLIAANSKEFTEHTINIALEQSRKAHYGKAEAQELMKLGISNEQSKWIACAQYMFPKSHSIDYFLTLCKSNTL